MGHRQVVLLRRGGLDDDAQALHAVDGDPVAAGQEHWRRRGQRSKTRGENVDPHTAAYMLTGCIYIKLLYMIFWFVLKTTCRDPVISEAPLTGTTTFQANGAINIFLRI